MRSKTEGEAVGIACPTAVVGNEDGRGKSEAAKGGTSRIEKDWDGVRDPVRLALEDGERGDSVAESDGVDEIVLVDEGVFEVLGETVALLDDVCVRDALGVGELEGELDREGLILGVREFDMDDEAVRDGEAENEGEAEGQGSDGSSAGQACLLLALI